MTTTTDLLRRAARRHWNLAKSAPTGHAERITRDGNALDALADQMERAEPVAWRTEDFDTDKSATTYSPDVRDRWIAKGWPVEPLYTHPAPEVTRDAEPVLCESCKAIGAAYKIGREASIPAEVTRDAERYRWLRSIDRRECLTKRGIEAGCWIDCEDANGTLMLLTEDDADAAIDAAMAQEPKP